MLTYIKRLTDERDSLTATATAITETAAREERDLNDTERASLAQMQTRCASIDDQLVTYNAQAESQRAYASLRSAVAVPPAEVVPAAGTDVELRPRHGVAVVEESWLAPITRSAAFAGYSGHGTSAIVECASPFADLEERATITTGTPPNSYVTPYRWTGNVQSPLVVAPLASACGYVRVNAGAVDYAYTTPSPAGAAPEVAEAALKAEAAFTIAMKSETLKTFAHWKALTRQALDDIPGIEATTRAYLQAGLQMAVENGIAAALAADATIETVTGDSMLAAARSGMATVQSAGRAVNVLLLNPQDWADIDLAVLAGTVGGPVVNSSPWGVKIVAAPDLPPGTGYVGDFKNGVTVFDRGVSNVYMTDSHADYFLSNILVILAETRMLPAITDATSLVKIGVTPAPPLSDAQSSRK